MMKPVNYTEKKVIPLSKMSAQRQINTAVKEWLWRYRKAKLALQRLEGEYEELVSVQESAGAVAYDGMPHAQSSNPDLSNLMIARDHLLTKLIKAKQYIADVYLEITQAIDQLDDDLEKDVMLLRYIRLKDGYGQNSMEDIADIIKYSPSLVKKKHGTSLVKLGRITGIDQRKR